MCRPFPFQEFTAVVPLHSKPDVDIRGAFAILKVDYTLALYIIVKVTPFHQSNPESTDPSAYTARRLPPGPDKADFPLVTLLPATRDTALVMWELLPFVELFAGEVNCIRLHVIRS